MALNFNFEKELKKNISNFEEENILKNCKIYFFQLNFLIIFTHLPIHIPKFNK